MLSKVPGKDVTVHIIAARVRMDMKVSEKRRSSIYYVRSTSISGSFVHHVVYVCSRNIHPNEGVGDVR